MKISAVILTKNSAELIKDCLAGLDWCDEKLVIDDQSEDQTRSIAQKMGAKVFKRSLNDNFAAQRNFGLGQARGEWALFVDADERVSAALSAEIKKTLESTEKTGFFLKRRDFFFGRWLDYGETGTARFLRLARRRSGRWERPVHETWVVKGELGQLQNPLEHLPHPSLASFLEKINFYTTLHAQALQQEGRRFRLWRLIGYPAAKFLQNYFWRRGFLDGLPGFLMAWMMSWHSFLAQAKLFERKKR